MPFTWAACPQGQPQRKPPRPTVLSRGSCLEGPEQSWCHLHCGGTKSIDCFQHGGWHLSDRWRGGQNVKVSIFDHINKCNYTYTSFINKQQNKTLWQNTDYNQKRKLRTSPGTPAFIHGEMSVPSAYPSSLVVLMRANNLTTSSMICYNPDKLEQLSAL